MFIRDRRFYGVYITGIYITGIYITGIYITGIYVTGVYIPGVYVTGVWLILPLQVHEDNGSGFGILGEGLIMAPTIPVSIVVSDASVINKRIFREVAIEN